ncbi:MAG: phosphodiester glycosidase family protein [Planctomycetota bacterium]
MNPGRRTPTRQACRALRGWLSLGVMAGVGLTYTGLVQAEPAPSAAVAEQKPIEIQAVERTTDAGPLRGWIARIDLSAPGLDVVVTGPHNGKPVSDAHETTLVTVEKWARKADVALAINTNFFQWLEPKVPHGHGGPAGVIGWLVTDGQVVSPPRQHEGQWDPVLAFDRTGRATITRGVPDNAWDAVAGVGGSGSDATPGTLLVEDGKPLGETARVAPLRRHPRTAVGLTADSGTLLVLVLDGRQPDWSVGATLPEVAQVLLDHGADRALALDGGGSSTFWYDPDGPGGQDPVTNRYSDPNGMRAVAAHLGFAFRPTPLAEVER